MPGTRGGYQKSTFLFREGAGVCKSSGTLFGRNRAGRATAREFSPGFYAPGPHQCRVFFKSAIGRGTLRSVISLQPKIRRATPRPEAASPFAGGIVQITYIGRAN